MSDLRDLYQEVILDHNRKPRNFRQIEGSDAFADGHNPLCGDNVTVFVKLEDDRISDISFIGSGCAISKASASMMTEAVRGLGRAEAEALFERFHDLVTGQDGASSDQLGKLASLSGVAEFPVRVKCATLPWHTLKAALDGQSEPITTE